MKDDRDDIEKARQRRLEQDLADLANEVVGRDVGRIRRFLPESAQGPQSAVARHRRAREDFTLQMLLAISAAYAAVYERVEAKLGAAQIATAGALSAIDDEITRTSDELDELMSRAARTADGRAVFRDGAGIVLTEDGELLPAEAAEQIDWPSGAPSWEEYRARKQALSRAQADRDEVLRYQLQVLDPAFARMADQEHPPSKEELETIEQQIETDMPAIVRERYNPRLRVRTEHNVEADVRQPSPDVETSDLAPPRDGALDGAEVRTAFNDAGRDNEAAPPASRVDLSIPKL